MLNGENVYRKEQNLSCMGTDGKSWQAVHSWVHGNSNVVNVKVCSLSHQTPLMSPGVHSSVIFVPKYKHMICTEDTFQSSITIPQRQWTEQN